MKETASRWPTYPTIPHIAVESLRSLQEGAIELDGDAALEKVDRDHQEPFLGAHADDHPLDVGERPTRDTHALPFAEIRVGEDREAGVNEPFNVLDLRIRDGVESVPALSEDAHEPARLVDLEVARPVHHVAQEEVSSEQRDAREAPDSAPSGDRRHSSEAVYFLLRFESRVA